MGNDIRMELLSLLTETEKLKAIIFHTVYSVEKLETNPKREAVERAKVTAYIMEDVFEGVERSINKIDSLICKSGL